MMKMFLLNGSGFILVTCVLIHFLIYTSNNWINYTLVSYAAITWNVSQGIAYLIYPIFGWIADIRITHYRMIKTSFIFVLISSTLMVVMSISMIIRPVYLRQQETLEQFICIASFTILLILGIGGLGLYESNAIQFGMDQMLEASSEQLSSFIHWYYWSLHLGQLAIYYVVAFVISYLQNCKFNLERSYGEVANIVLGWMLLFPSFIQAVFVTIGLFIIIKSKKYVYIDKRRKNPLKNIIQVLKYSWKHKYPVYRSAFTYWENDIPSRIDLSKHKYGGPFTNEQVEDVKTLLQLLLLILSLFGFQLSGDGYSLNQYMINNIGCPTKWTMLLLVMNPEHITLLMILTGIPLYQFFVKKYLPRYIPSLMNRMGIGLFLCLIREMSLSFISILVYPTEHNSYCLKQKLYAFAADNSSVIVSCLVGQAKELTNQTCETACLDVVPLGDMFLLLIVPQLLYGISYILIFMSVLEFICAQAPQSMKGLLIGLWYANYSIKYFTVGILDTHIVKETAWNIYHGVKGFGIFLSVVSFFLVCKFYHYRERDEIVNEQAIIEEQYERELLCNREKESKEV